LSGQAVRTASATATTASTVRVVETAAMMRLLHDDPALADCFIGHMLATNIRIEEALLDHLFNVESTEWRLARTLLLGFISRNGDTHIHSSLVSLVLED
jgi:CRP/FNR family transcriptional regulator, cyclic AMP receptor protein